MRTCRVCEQAKPLTDFERATGGYYRRQCRSCRHEQMAPWFRQWRADNQAKLREQSRDYHARTGHLSPPARGAWQKWTDANPGRIAQMGNVRKTLHEAVRKGLIERPSACSQCERPGKVEGAHADYTKPLSVKWLCHSCHTSWDREQPKTLGSGNQRIHNLSGR